MPILEWSAVNLERGKQWLTISAKAAIGRKVADTELKPELHHVETLSLIFIPYYLSPFPANICIYY